MQMKDFCNLYFILIYNNMTFNDYFMTTWGINKT